VNWRLLKAIGAFVAIVAIFSVVYAATHLHRANRAEHKAESIELGSVIESASPSLSRELALWLRDQPDANLLGDNKEEYYAILLPKWALADAPAAANFFDELGEPQRAQCYEAEHGIGRAWAAIDPLGALAWADKHTYPTSDGSDSLWSETIAGWASVDLPAAASYVAQHINRQGGQQAAATIIDAMVNEDETGGKAAEWQQTLPSGFRKYGAANHLGFIWGKKDPAACARWIKMLPPDEQPAAVNGLMIVWTGKNWPEASKWIGTAEGQLRDQAIATAINIGFRTVPTRDAIPLALSVTDSKLRHRAIGDAVAHWAIEGERKAAVSWVKQSSLSEQEKREILSLDVLKDPLEEIFQGIRRRLAPR
jgi:hypothetical protein